MATNESKEKNVTKKSRFGTALKLITLLVLGGLVGWGLDPILGSLGLDLGGANASPWVVIPGLIVSFFFVLAFHEAGHVVGGKLVGFRFTLFVVGPFKLYSTPGGVRLGLNRSLMLAGGLGGATPTDSRNLTHRMTAYVAGGPVASLLLAVAAFGLFFIAPPSIGIILALAAVTSLGIGVVTLIPNKTGGLVSDGARLLMLRRNGPEAERWCALAALSGASMLGKRPRDWDEEMVRKSLAHPDSTFDDAGASSTAYYHALDLGRIDEAETLLERALSAENLPEMMRSQTLLENAFFQASFRQDTEKARSLFSKAQPGKVLEKHLPVRAEAAILFAEGEGEKAKQKAHKSLEALDRSFSAGTAKLEKEWLEDLVEAGVHHDTRNTTKQGNS